MLKKILDELSYQMQYNLRYIYYRIFQRDVSSNIGLSGSASGDCFILFTGSSVNEFDLNLLKGKNIVATNHLYMHQHYPDLEVSDYVVLENWSLKNVVFLGYMLDLIILRRKQTNKKMRLWLSHSFKAYLNTINYHHESYSSRLLSHVDIHHILNVGEITKTDEIKMDFSKAVNVGTGVKMASIFLAKYLGYEKIYLIGNDHSISPLNIGHFYELNNEVHNDFDKNNFTQKRLHAQNKMLVDCLNASGIEIYNIVPPGKNSIGLPAAKFEDVVR